MAVALAALLILAGAPAPFPGRAPHPDAPARVALIPCLVEQTQGGREPDQLFAAGAFAPFKAGRAAFAPDGATVLLNNADLLAVADVKTGKSLFRLQAGLEQNVNKAVCPGAIGFSSDGTLVFAADFVGAALFDASTGKPVRFVNHPVRVVEPLDRFSLLPNTVVAVGPRGALLAFGDQKRPGIVSLVDGATGNLVREVTLKGALSALAFSPDGARLAALGPEVRGNIALDLIDVASGAVQRHLELRVGSTMSPVEELLFEPSGQLRVRVGFTAVHLDPATGAEKARKTVQGGGTLSARADRIMHTGGVLVDASTGARVPPSRWTDKGLAAFAVAVDGTLAYAGLETDSGLGVLSGGTGEEVRLPLATDRDTRLAFSADGQTLWATDRHWVLHRFVRNHNAFVSAGQKPFGIVGDTARELVPAADGKTVAVWMGRDRVGEMIGLFDGVQLTEKGKRTNAQYPRFARAADVFAYNTVGPTPTLVLEEASSGRELKRLPVMRRFSLTADAKFVVGLGVDRGELVYLRRRVADGVVVARGSNHKFISAAVTSPDGALGAMPVPLRPVQVISVDHGAAIAELNPYWSQQLTFAPDERSLYGVGLDRSIARWAVSAPPRSAPIESISAGELASRLEQHQSAFTACFQKFPDPSRKKRVVKAMLWAGKTGQVSSVALDVPLRGTPLGDCLDDAVARIRFPASVAGLERVPFTISE